MRSVPSFLKGYFWDVDFKKISLARNHRVFILKRILEYGDQKAVSWMWKHFKKPEIRNALCKFRGYSQKSANFWALILDVPKEKVLCLRRRLPKGLEKIWPY